MKKGIRIAGMIAAALVFSFLFFFAAMAVGPAGPCLYHGRGDNNHPGRAAHQRIGFGESGRRRGKRPGHHRRPDRGSVSAY